MKEPLLSNSPTTYESSLALSSYPTFRENSPQSFTYSRRSTTPHTPSSDHSSVYLYRTPSPVAEVSETFEAKPSSQPVTTRPRSKSKPSRIFIHPSESNLARADAAALELGLAGDTELVKGNQYPAEGPAWQAGKGKDLARELMGRRMTVN